MQYIRIKDAIIDLNRTHLDGSPIYNLDTKENVIKANENREERDCYYIENDTIYDYCYSDGCIWEEHIIKQADTIKELCDEFVYKNEFYDNPIRCYCSYGIWYDYNDEMPLSEEENSTIKGAIWTDKGLIYVAKMNKDGKLELI